MPINADITLNLGPSIMYQMLGQGIFDNTVCPMLISALPNDIVANHIMPKVMELIMSVKAYGTKILREPMMKALLCIYKYIGINKAWHLHFGMLFIYNGHKFRGVSTTILLDKFICDHCFNNNIFRTTQHIAIPIQWRVQHAWLKNIWILNL